MSVIIIKLGGSLITNKNIPFSVDYNSINNIIKQIKNFYEQNTNSKLILVHGGGSFGHPMALNYKIHEGINESIINQNYGLAQDNIQTSSDGSVPIQEDSPVCVDWGFCD